eukprot:1073631-Prorocentrum_lima.AAC.1
MKRAVDRVWEIEREAARDQILVCGQGVGYGEGDGDRDGVREGDAEGDGDGVGSRRDNPTRK